VVSVMAAVDGGESGPLPVSIRARLRCFRAVIAWIGVLVTLGWDNRRERAAIPVCVHFFRA
jgi:hypothetical protein